MIEKHNFGTVFVQRFEIIKICLILPYKKLHKNIV